MAVVLEYGPYTYGRIKAIGKEGRLSVGKFCSIAGGVTAILTGHRIDWVSTFPFTSREFQHSWGKAAGQIGGHPATGSVGIGNDVWMGQDVTFLPGARVGHGAVIGAGAVVRAPVPPYAIVYGNPSGIKAMRFEDWQIELLLAIAWWDWPEEKIKENIPLICSEGVSEFVRRHHAGF